MPTNSVGSDPNTAAGMQAKASSPAPGSRFGLARAVMRYVPKFAYLLPPIRTKSLQRLRERLGIPTRTHETQRPFSLSTRLAVRVRKLGLEQAVRDVSKNGFGHIHELAPVDFTDQLRETVRRIASAQPDGRANMLLDKDPIFEEVVLNPKILALAEVMCGRGALLSQLVGCVIKKNPPVADLHVTQNRLPAPFPEHNQMVTFCWACDEQTKEAGAIKVVPGSQHHRRPPLSRSSMGHCGTAAGRAPSRESKCCSTLLSAAWRCVPRSRTTISTQTGPKKNHSPFGCCSGGKMVWIRLRVL